MIICYEAVLALKERGGKEEEPLQYTVQKVGRGQVA